MLEKQRKITFNKIVSLLNKTFLKRNHNKTDHKYFILDSFLKK